MSQAAGTFQTVEPGLDDILKYVHSGSWQLPDFQRGWVWDDNRIRALIASVSMSYPIGAIMTMDVSDQIRFLPRFFEGVTLTDKTPPATLVLDGQQRLTSLYLALMSKDAVPTVTEKKKEIKRFYYLDMLKCLDPSADRLDAIISVPETRQITSVFGKVVDLDLSTSEMEFENCMCPLNIIFNLVGYSEWKQAFIKYYESAPEKYQFLNQFDMEVWLRFQQYKIPVINLTKSTPKEAVCQVFENVNTGGVSLTVFELLTATFAADNFQLRKDWEERKLQLQQQNILKGVDESTYLTAVTLLTSYKRSLNYQTAVSCKRKDILKLSLEEYQENANQIISGLQTAAKLLARENIFDNRNIPYQTQLIPLSAICAYLDNRAENDFIKQKLIQWYWCGVLGELYGGANESRYALDMQGVISWLDGGDIPATIRDSNFSPTRLLTLQSRLSAAYKGLYALLMKEGSKDFINGDEIGLTTYFDDAIDIHHIFPAVYCEKMGYNRDQWNSIVNKAALSSRTNRMIGGHQPSTYLTSIKNRENIDSEHLHHILQTHLINPELLENDDFNNFIINRAKSLLDMIEKATGKPIQGRESDEVVNAFGGVLK